MGCSQVLGSQRSVGFIVPEVGRGWAWELWCRARGMTRTHVWTPQAGMWDVMSRPQAG